MLTRRPKVQSCEFNGAAAFFCRAAALAACLCLPGPGVASAGFLPANSFTDDARGLTAAQFLKVPPSARFSALGGTGLTLGGPDSFFLNPAGTCANGGSAQGVSASYEALLEGTSRTGLAYSKGTPAGVFSAGLLYNNASPGLEKLDGAGGAFGSFTAYDAAFGAGWARRLGWADLGFNLKYIKSRLADEAGAGAALDAGLVFRENKASGTELALAARNLGPPFKLGSERAPLPLELGAGIKWKYSRDFNIYAEGRLPCDHAPYLAFAGEWFLPSARLSGLFLRTGLNFRNYSDHGFMGTFSGGFGLKLGGFLLDYAFAPYGELGAAHRMTAGWGWGAAAREPAVLPVARASALVVALFSSGDGVEETEADVVRGLLESELLKTKRFKVVERSKLDFILAEKKLSYAGLPEAGEASELARLFKAELAVFGSVEKDAKGYSVTARLVEADSEKILRSETVRVKEDYQFREAARQLAAALSK